MARVLVVDDDPSLLRALRLALGALGHEVFSASNGEQGISQAALVDPDVVVLDLGLPDIDGLRVVRAIREWNDVPIVVLSATDAEERKVAALDGGADDYVTKPFGMAELEARVRAALRHRQQVVEDTLVDIVVGGLELDLVHHGVRLDGMPVDLTLKEFEVLAYLAKHAGMVCTHQMILTAVWGSAYGKEAQYLHVYIHRLRQKLSSAHDIAIKTASGIGYVLEMTGETSPPPLATTAL